MALSLAAVLYTLAYLPYVILTRWVSTQASTELGEPLSGLNILPSLLIISALLTYCFMYAAGWGRTAHRISFSGFSIPSPTPWTFISGVCASLILVTVPLSFTFRNVSIPFMQLLMRGDILIIAPLVDVIFGRRVRWWSWVALGLVGCAMLLAISGRGGVSLPMLAIVAIVLYTVGYFGRLFAMTKISKLGDRSNVKKYFTEETIVSFPASILILGIIAGFSSSPQSRDLHWGFAQAWTSHEMLVIALCAFSVFLTGIFSAMILLDRRENAFCVALERSASIIAGVLGSVLLALFFGGRMPSGGELWGGGLLILAIVVLSVGPQVSRLHAGKIVLVPESRRR